MSVSVWLNSLVVHSLFPTSLDKHKSMLFQGGFWWPCKLESVFVVYIYAFMLYAWFLAKTFDIYYMLVNKKKKSYFLCNENPQTCNLFYK